MRYLLILLLAGCASPGIVSTGPDSYMLTKSHGAISGGNLLSRTYAEAGAFCSKQGKQIETITSSSIGSHAFRSANAELHFRCIGK